MAESRGDPNAANRTDVHRDINGAVICRGSFGLMQISCHHGELFDPERNMAEAYRKYSQRGWQPWGAYTSGAYKKYL